MPLIPEPINCDASVKRAIRLISRKLGYTGNPIHANLTLTDLTASRLIATDSGKTFASVADLTTWIAGTTNQIVVSDDGDGTITLSTPQDIHVDATPEFAGITIKNSGDEIIFYVDNDEMYFTAASGTPVVGNPYGLLLILTYPA